MSAEDWLPDFAFEDYDDLDPIDVAIYPPRFKVCKYCGKSKLRWGQHRDGWRLAELDGTIHSCKK